MISRAPIEIARSVKYQPQVYANRSQAEEAMKRLHDLGYDNDHVSMIVGEKSLLTDGLLLSALAHKDEAEAERTGFLGAAMSAAVGASLVLLSRAGVVLGPLAISVVGVPAAAFGVIIGLLDLGFEAEELHERLQRGHVALIVTLKSRGDRDAVRHALGYSD